MQGEHASRVVYASTFKKSETAEDGSEVERDIPFLKEYCVFNVEQITGLPAHFYAVMPEGNKNPDERLAQAEVFVTKTGAQITYGGNQAFYMISRDQIMMFEWENFRSKEGFYGTLLHDLIHWTRHESRLNREFGRKRFGDDGYAMEELVAEIGAAFLCCELGITPEVREDHAGYIENWLRVLKNDKRAMFTAAAHAQKACDLLFQHSTVASAAL